MPIAAPMPVFPAASTPDFLILLVLACDAGFP